MVKAFLSLAALAAVTSLAAAPAFDAARVKTGRFSYDVRDRQAVVATGVLRVARDAAGSYAFDGTFAAAVCQHWESKATRAFTPQSALLLPRTWRQLAL